MIVFYEGIAFDDEACFFFGVCPVERFGFAFPCRPGLADFFFFFGWFSYYHIFDGRHTNLLFLLIYKYREPLTIHFGEQANLFDSGRRHVKTALALAKADLPSLSEYKNLLLAAQKQLLELPFRLWILADFMQE